MAVALALLAVIPSAMAGPADPPRPQGAGPAPDPTAFVPFSPNVRVNSGGLGYNHQVEPTMVFNSAGHVFVGWKEAITASGGGQRVAFSHSGDGGRTWAPNVLMDLAILAHQSDPWLTVTGSDRVFFTRIEYSDTASAGGISVTNTTDGVAWGTTWYYPDDPNFADKESAAHDAAGNLYWVWNSDSNTQDLAFARSNNGGQSWTPKLYVNDRSGTLGGIVQVAPSGTVLATWWDYVGDNILFDRSSNGGTTWGTDVRVNPFSGSAWSPSQWVIPIPAMVVGQNGTIFVAWSDSRTGNRDIVVSRSADGGATWSGAVRVNDDAGTATQYMPDLAIDGQGTLHVAWEDDRTGQRNIFYANSTNGGVSFGPNVLVTTVGTPVSYIRPGDYLAIEAAPNGTVGVVWTDGRGADLDIYFASLPGDASTVLDTVPPGLTLQLDGTPVTAPYRFLCPPGPPHMIAAPSPQVVGSSRYTFGSWSDGQAQSHSITCGTTHAYTAYFTTEHQVTIATAPPGLTVVVDTIPAATPQTNWWPQGSVHTVSATSPQTQGSTRYVYLSWSDGGAQSHGLTIAAPATYTANFRTEYEVALDSSPSNLTLTVDGSPVTAPGSFWWAQGSTHAIGAPSPQVFGLTQYTFSGWSDGGAQNHTITANAPGTYTANFGVEYQITVATQPTGIEVLVDGNPFPAPYIFWCVGGASHAIDAPTPILIPGSRATFLSWSDGGAQAHTITCTAPGTFTATFLFEEFVTIDTVPAGLQLALDGPTVTAPHSFWCAQNSGHTVDALSPQGTTGTRYAFASWSDSGARSHAILCDAPRMFTANFATEFEITVATDPPGLDVLVDATLGAAPLTFWWADGSTHPLDLASPQGAGSTRFMFSGWSDGGPVAHLVTANAPAVLTASFTTQHRIDVASPRGTVSCDVADCWYDAGTAAGFGVSPATIDGPTGTRYVFDGWMGDSTAATASATLTMDAPKSVTARWRTEHLLTIVSPYGTPSGAGWYVEGSAAPVSIETSIADGGSTYRFTGWTGGATGGTASISVTMDGPKTITATWERVTANPGSGFSSWLLWIVLLGVAVLLLVLFLWRRRKKEPDEPAPPPA